MTKINLVQALLVLTTSIVQHAHAAYSLTDDYSGKNFFPGFTFFTDPDPTQGLVEYVDLKTASNKSLAGFLPESNNSVYLGVDYKTVLQPNQTRQSVRLTSTKSYNHGLFIADIGHMPGGICSVWPAYWLVNNDGMGEIDIIEGINDQANNSITLHTGAGCSINSTTQSSSGLRQSTDCDINSPNQPKNVGCSFTDMDAASYGTGFNAAGGGVYAMEWTSSVIQTWFWKQGFAPADIAAGAPVPGTWGQPVAKFTGCQIDEHFKDLQIIFDTTLCGSWAGQPSIWADSPQCLAKAPTCDEFVASNPEAFTEAYWAINSLKVYEDNGS